MIEKHIADMEFFQQPFIVLQGLYVDQLEKLEQIAEEKGTDIATIVQTSEKSISNTGDNDANLKVDEGLSGKNIKGRQEFMRMLNDIEDGKDGVDFVLVFKLSRFGRNAADVLSSLQIMQDYGVNLICVKDGIDGSKEAGKW